ncbi:hypothetical protein EPN18_07380 [bacterium]|nr:MAG: hypothetical protein EPN18_07380 [bacterium]
MASNYVAIAANIKTKLLTVANIGQVHDYYRWSKDAGAFLAMFSATIGGVKQIRGWEITRTAVTEHKHGAFWRHHQFRISGYMGLQDAAGTDKTFQTLVENICETFRTADGGATWDYRNGDSPDNSAMQVNTIDVREFGAVLCHYAEITLSVTEKIIA